jgi:hypothetical protein
MVMGYNLCTTTGVVAGVVVSVLVDSDVRMFFCFLLLMNCRAAKLVAVN